MKSDPIVVAFEITEDLRASILDRFKDAVCDKFRLETREDTLGLGIVTAISLTDCPSKIFLTAFCLNSSYFRVISFHRKFRVPLIKPPQSALYPADYYLIKRNVGLTTEDALPSEFQMKKEKL